VPSTRPNWIRRKALAERIRDHVGGLKLGLEFFLANGTVGYQQIAALKRPIFLDVKLHDIPNTVAGAITSLLPLNPAFITLHTSGGKAMMHAAVEAVHRAGDSKPKLLGVTVLTSLNTSDLAAVGQDTNTLQHVTRLAQLAKDCGLDGLVCSPEEVRPLRAVLGPDFIFMVPGIRPIWAEANDQKRVMTPHEAMRAGATYLVIGRPISAANDPADAAQKIVKELA
jgi:orotidine-5'-phosphate decarboxylase